MIEPEQILPGLFHHTAKYRADYACKKLIEDFRCVAIELAFRSPLFGRDERRAIAILEGNTITIDNGGDALPNLLGPFYAVHIEWHHEQLTRPEGEMPVADIIKDSGFIPPEKPPNLSQKQYDEICALETEAHRWGMCRIMELFPDNDWMQKLYTVFAWSDVRYYMQCMAQPDPIAARLPPQQRLIRILEGMREALKDPSLCGLIKPLDVDYSGRVGRSPQQINSGHVYINVL